MEKLSDTEYKLLEEKKVGEKNWEVVKQKQLEFTHKIAILTKEKKLLVRKIAEIDCEIAELKIQKNPIDSAVVSAEANKVVTNASLTQVKNRYWDSKEQI